MSTHRKSGSIFRRVCEFIDRHLVHSESRTGFTIVEALIGITILAGAVAGPMTAAQLGISTSRHARDILSASMLAGEAVELLRNVRDNNVLVGDWKGAIKTDDGPFEISAVTGEMRNCNSACDVLYYSPSTHLYGFDDDSSINDWRESEFRRTVEVAETDSNEVLITVTMEWERGGKSRSYEVKEILTNWANTDND